MLSPTDLLLGMFGVMVGFNHPKFAHPQGKLLNQIPTIINFGTSEDLSVGIQHAHHFVERTCRI